MTSFVVMEPPRGAGADEANAVFVRDGFTIFAFLIPAVWLLWHRLWIEAALAIALAIGLTALGEVAGLGISASLLSLLVSIYAGLEGAALRVAALKRRDWNEWGVVEADTLEDAEIRYLVEREGETPAPFPVLAAAQPTFGAARPAPQGPALGLFNYPGRT